MFLVSKLYEIFSAKQLYEIGAWLSASPTLAVSLYCLTQIFA